MSAQYGVSYEHRFTLRNRNLYTCVVNFFSVIFPSFHFIITSAIATLIKLVSKEVHNVDYMELTIVPVLICTAAVWDSKLFYHSIK